MASSQIKTKLSVNCSLPIPPNAEMRGTESYLTGRQTCGVAARWCPQPEGGAHPAAWFHLRGDSERNSFSPMHPRTKGLLRNSLVRRHAPISATGRLIAPMNMASHELWAFSMQPLWNCLMTIVQRQVRVNKPSLPFRRDLTVGNDGQTELLLTHFFPLYIVWPLSPQASSVSLFNTVMDEIAQSLTVSMPQSTRQTQLPLFCATACINT